MKKLMSMVETVPEHQHAKFLQQTPTPGMFVPAILKDCKWVVLEKPNKENYILTNNQNNKGNIIDLISFNKYLQQYQQAEQRVIFEGWEINQKDISKLENIICITKDKTQLTFFKLENSIFLDNLITNQTFEIRTIEDLVPYNLTLK